MKWSQRHSQFAGECGREWRLYGDLVVAGQVQLRRAIGLCNEVMGRVMSNGISFVFEVHGFEAGGSARLLDLPNAWSFVGSKAGTSLGAAVVAAVDWPTCAGTSADLEGWALKNAEVLDRLDESWHRAWEVLDADLLKCVSNLLRSGE